MLLSSSGLVRELHRASQAGVEKGGMSRGFGTPLASSFTQGRQVGAHLTRKRFCDPLSEKGV